MEDAQGGVLFIDEAYDFASNAYGREALAELCVVMTRPEFQQTVVVMAGYPESMRDMMKTNDGVPRRFTRSWEFPDWDADKCWNLSRQEKHHCGPVSTPRKREGIVAEHI